MTTPKPRLCSTLFYSTLSYSMVTADIRRSEGIQSVVGRARPRGPGPSVRLNNQEFNPALAEPGLIPLIDLVRLALPPIWTAQAVDVQRSLRVGCGKNNALGDENWRTYNGVSRAGLELPGWLGSVNSAVSVWPPRAPLFGQRIMIMGLSPARPRPSFSCLTSLAEMNLVLLLSLGL